MCTAAAWQRALQPMHLIQPHLHGHNRHKLTPHPVKQPTSTVTLGKWEWAHRSHQRLRQTSSHPRPNNVSLTLTAGGLFPFQATSMLTAVRTESGVQGSTVDI
jgi:hypothetical protein